MSDQRRIRKRKRDQGSSGESAPKRRKIHSDASAKVRAREAELIKIVRICGQISEEDAHKWLISRIASGESPDVPAARYTVQKSLQKLVADGRLMLDVVVGYYSLPPEPSGSVAVSTENTNSENVAVSTGERFTVGIEEIDNHTDAIIGSVNDSDSSEEEIDVLTDAIDSSSDSDSDSDGYDLDCRTVRLCVPVDAYIERYTIRMGSRKRKRKRKR